MGSEPQVRAGRELEGTASRHKCLCGGWLYYVSTLASESVWKSERIAAFSRPPPHDCIVTPRFPEVVSILAEECESFGN